MDIVVGIDFELFDSETDVDQLERKLNLCTLFPVT